MIPSVLFKSFYKDGTLTGDTNDDQNNIIDRNKLPKKVVFTILKSLYILKEYSNVLSLNIYLNWSAFLYSTSSP